MVNVNNDTDFLRSKPHFVYDRVPDERVDQY